MKVTRKIIEIDEALCNGCGQCVPGCAEGALRIVDGKAKLLAEKYCDGLGACLGGCPTGALRIVEREAEDFDEEAVEELLHQKEEEPMACGCPSSRLQVFQPTATPCQAANQPKSLTGPGEVTSRLTHWPVQIRLVPATAPFLKNADLLVAADCTPLAYPHFHRDLLAGRVVMMGCPKFDETGGYVQKFAEIFATARIKSVTVAIMEVPCCANMRAIIRRAMEMAGREIPVTEIVISARGEIIRQGAMAA
jgi:Fe-S-cluster-containing hydrogenase component 2